MLDSLFYSAVARGGAGPTPIIMEIWRNKMLIDELPIYIS